uniref:Uncharacterized protein n=1 Tax=Setaria digitata TaxID=48799 RepID=A0A915Q0Z9_9BILA
MSEVGQLQQSASGKATKDSASGLGYKLFLLADLNFPEQLRMQLEEPKAERTHCGLRQKKYKGQYLKFHL